MNRAATKEDTTPATKEDVTLAMHPSSNTPRILLQCMRILDAAQNRTIFLWMEWILWLQSCRPNPVVATLSVSPKRFFDSSPTILHLEPTRFDSPRVSGRNLLPEVQRRFEKKNRTGRVHVERPEERGGLAVRSDCFVFHCWHPKIGNLCANDSKLRNV